MSGDDRIRLSVAPENRDWSEENPIWNPTGSHVVYSSNESGTWDIYSRSGTTVSEPVVRSNIDQMAEAMANDGTLAYLESHPTTGYDIVVLNLFEELERRVPN